jgi:hypothetical protein
MGEIKRYPCPGCGRSVICDDAARTVYHEDPQCDRFAAKMLEIGLTPCRVEPTMFVAPTDGPPS